MPNHLYIKCIILPRHARDKHPMVKLNKRRRFLTGPASSSGAATPAQNCFHLLCMEKWLSRQVTASKADPDPLSSL